MKKLTTLLASVALAAAAFGQTPDPAKLELARATIAAMQVDKMLEGMSGQLKQMAAQQAQMPANATPEQRKLFEDFMGKVTDISMEEVRHMIGKMDVIYASVYSEAELKAIRAFFVSPEGQSMLAKQPTIMAQTMPIIQDMQRSILPKVQALAAEFSKNLKAAAPEAAAPAAPAPEAKP